ncbi:MAG: cytochrome C [Acidimicrobiaceae bacterium]|nr:cytochrome C [Acidimicrobiaceae bacterium]
MARFGLSAIVVLTVIQVVPYGREHSNPPVAMEPAWSTPETRELMVRACFGCHSNEVMWPTYSNIAPFSWAVTQHVQEGRDEINYSEFGSGKEDDDTIETILEGDMPPGYYTVFGLHPEANLTGTEVDALVAGLRDTPGFVEDDG